VAAIRYLPAVFAAIYTVLEYIFKRLLRIPVSYPGGEIFLSRRLTFLSGPRPKRLLRKGNWRKESLKVSANWTFAEDRESHEVTEAAAGNGLRLTGESAGRQIWYQPASSPSDEAGDSESPFEFNPSKNPNTSDLLFRDIQTKKWSPAPTPLSLPLSSHQPLSPFLVVPQERALCVHREANKCPRGGHQGPLLLPDPAVR
jgi:hypothetical protein